MSNTELSEREFLLDLAMKLRNIPGAVSIAGTDQAVALCEAADRLDEIALLGSDDSPRGQQDLEAQYDQLCEFLPAMKAQNRERGLAMLKTMRTIAPNIAKTNIVAAAWVQNVNYLGSISTEILHKLMKTEALYRELNPYAGARR